MKRPLNKNTIICCIVVVSLVIVYLIAKAFLGIAYSSEDLIKGITDNNNKLGGGSIEEDWDWYDKELSYEEPMEYLEGYNMGYDSCFGIPYQVYNDKDVEERARLFLGEEYSSYKPILDDIVGKSDEYFKGIEYDWCWGNWKEEDDFTKLRSGDYTYCTINDILSADYLEFSINSLEYNDCEAYAIYFYNNYYVVYEAQLADSKMLMVVDYSKTAFNPSTLRVQFGGILNNGLAVYLDNANYQTINGWNVLFIKNDPGRYIDRNGNQYSGQDLINMRNKNIEW